MSDVNRSKKPNLSLLVRSTGKAQAKINQSTGPRTAEGKCIASSNSANHGCTATLTVKDGQLTLEALARIVLPDENPADWAALLQNWQSEYQPESDLGMDLVARAAVADWLMRRTARRHDEAERRLYGEQPDATLWSVEQHALLERFLRYQARAERSYYRSRNALEQVRREQKADHEKVLASQAPPRAAAAKSAASAKEADAAAEEQSESVSPRTAGALIQCVTVQVLNGKTFTLFQPRSENLARIIVGADLPKPTVKRALYFLDGIPEEYGWITEYESHDGRPHFVIERSSEEALQDLERERTDGNGHVLRVK